MSKQGSDRADVVICGAGMAGVCTAYFLTGMGVDDVLLVDRGYPLSLTSDKSAETYHMWAPSEPMYEFVNRSTKLMEDVAEETDNIFNLNRRGECYVATSAERAATLRAMTRDYAHLGLGPARIHDGRDGDLPEYEPPAATGYKDWPAGSDLLLDKQRIEQFFPYLCDRVTAVLHARSCGWFSAHTLGMCLLERAKKRGARELRGEAVAVEHDKQGVSGVRIHGPDGAQTIHTRRFVNAAGPFVKRVATLLDVDLPVRTGLWEKIVFDDYLGVIPRSAPTVILRDRLFLEWSEEDKKMLRQSEDDRWLLQEFSSGPYMRPEGGEGSSWVLIGWAYNEPPFKVWRERDEDREGAGVVCEPQWEPKLTRDFPEIVLRGMAGLVPGLRQYLVRLPKFVHDAGYGTETRDVEGDVFREENPALIGPMGIEGAYVVNACHGVSMACAAGELCATWITGNELPDYAGALSPMRYGDLIVA